ncbi:MAG: hypothetical protein JWO00_673 [Candidatus Parcubacteria bacterium]|nr:hypothetical protein [Candidatus Parcubacteria bacterium]
MKNTLSLRIFVLLVFAYALLNVAGAGRAILCVTIVLMGLTAFLNLNESRADKKTENLADSIPDGSKITKKYGGKEVEVYLYSGIRIIGKIAALNDQRSIPGYVLMRDARVAVGDEDSQATENDALKDEINIEVSQITIVIFGDMDKV